jgi:hypothetical protein
MHVESLNKIFLWKECDMGVMDSDFDVHNI